MSRAEHLALCTAILEVAKCATSRLMVRDHFEGFVSLPARERVGVERRAGDLDRCLVALGAAWTAAEATDPGTALGRIGALVVSPEEVTLLALAVAPELDRAMARTMTMLGDGGALTCGLLLDLLAPATPARIALAELLHAGAPLRALRLLHVDSVVVTASARVRIVPSVVAVLRGESLPPPAGVARIDGGDQQAAMRALGEAGLERLRPGAIHMLDAEVGAAQATAAQLAAASGAPLWMFAPGEDDGAAILTDAWLAGAVAGIDLRGPRYRRVDAVAQQVAALRLRAVSLIDVGTLASGGPRRA